VPGEGSRLTGNFFQVHPFFRFFLSATPAWPAEQVQRQQLQEITGIATGTGSRNRYTSRITVYTGFSGTLRRTQGSPA